MKKLKQMLAALVCFAMLVSVLPTGVVMFANAESDIKTKLESVIASYPAGGRWTGSFDGGKECYGFAKLVIYNLFGKYNSSRYRSWTYAGVSTSGMNVVGSITSYSASNVKDLLSKAKPGDALQFDSTKQHSMIVYSVNDSSVTVYDCNWDGNCGIRLTNCSYGTWSGRNSAKLTLLRSDNYPETHMHSYVRYFEAAHPHRVYMKCSCGDWYYTGETTTMTGCTTCYPPRNTYVRGWIGDQNGNTKSTWDLGDAVYLWYKIYDKNTGDLYNTYSSDSYAVKMTLYRPDGTATNSCSYRNHDTAWISHGLVGYDYGECSFEIEAVWDNGYAETICGTFKVGCNAIVSVDKTTVNLRIKSNPCDTITYALDGVWPDYSKFELVYDSSVIQVDKVDDAPESRKITALKAGETDLKIVIFVSKDSIRTSGNTIRALTTHVVVADDYSKITSAPYWGDMNGDYSIDSDDIEQIMNIASGTITPTAEQKCFADLDLNGKVEKNDAARLNSYRNGYADTLLAETIADYHFFEPKKTIYVKGETLETSGLKLVISNKNDTSVKYEFTNLTVKGFDSSKVGTQVLTASFRGQNYMFVVTVVEGSYTVSYNANGATSGSVPTSQTKIYGKTLTLAQNTGNLSKTGYVLDGWSDTSSGAKVYDLGGSYNSNRSATLYAHWTANTYKVQFNGNGSTGGSMSNQSFTYDIAQSLAANTFKRAYTVTFNYNGATGGNANATVTATATFNGWSTSTNGAKVYNDKQSVRNLAEGGMFHLYANWTLGTVALPMPTRVGYSFGGWFTDSALKTPADIPYTPKTNVTLYAKWTAIAVTELAVKTMPDKTSYFVGDTLDTAGLSLTATKSNGASETVTSGFSCTPTKLTTEGTQTITVSYGGKSTTFIVSVQSKPIMENEPCMTLSKQKASEGDHVDVTLSVVNNPGIVATSVSLTYDKTKLRLIGVKDGGLLGTTSFSPGNDLTKVPYTVVWEDGLSTKNYTANGILATFTFDVLEGVQPGETTITLNYVQNSTINVDLNEVEFALIDGSIEVTDRTPADINKDGIVDLKDVVLLRRFLSGGWDVTINESSADVNGDHTIDLKDTVILRRYLSGGWNVELK